MQDHISSQSPLKRGNRTGRPPEGWELCPLGSSASQAWTGAWAFFQSKKKRRKDKKNDRCLYPVVCTTQAVQEAVRNKDLLTMQSQFYDRILMHRQYKMLQSISFWLTIFLASPRAFFKHLDCISLLFSSCSFCCSHCSLEQETAAERNKKKSERQPLTFRNHFQFYVKTASQAGARRWRASQMCGVQEMKLINFAKQKPAAQVNRKHSNEWGGKQTGPGEKYFTRRQTGTTIWQSRRVAIGVWS